jgi:hypothetical protein
MHRESYLNGIFDLLLIVATRRGLGSAISWLDDLIRREKITEDEFEELMGRLCEQSESFPQPEPPKPE